MSKKLKIKKNILAIVQARLDSVRFPSKVLKKINGFSVIELLLLRLAKSQLINEIVVAIPAGKNNKNLAEHVSKLGHKVFIGSKKDVLDRYLKAAKRYKADIVVRITGDCPLVDPILVDKIVSKFLKTEIDYLSNTNPATFPDGLDVEVLSFKALFKCWKKTKKKSEREHVTTFIRESKLFRTSNYNNEKDFSDKNWAIDEPEDLKQLKKIMNYFYPKIYFGWKQLIKVQEDNPKLFYVKSNKKRDDGSKLSSGQKLWKRAKRIIPGGNMLLSKREDRFLPNKWPNYFSKAKGCAVWDLDGKKFIDISLMGVGTNILGYGNEEIDNEVRKTIKKGNISTLNCPEEVYLSEKLIKIHPWSSMVKLTRTGGEANAVAIRIARAACGKDKVAVCGYHGWHDWYIAANLKNSKNLDQHLLSGVNTLGVPKNLKNSVLTFRYNNILDLEKIVHQNPDLGIIKMEVSRNHEPKDGFLQKVREIANKKGIILIFDECTSGFRETFGGLHKKYKIFPDIAIFGKSLGNGYAINAVIGKRNIMKFAEKTFISSTFWTERVGPTAAVKTLEIMNRTKSWQKITKTGKKIKKEWNRLANKYQLKIQISGLNPLCNFKIFSKNEQAYKTLITQEMLKKGYLASNVVYACTAHSDEIIDGYIFNLDKVFKLIKECEDGRDIKKLLEGPVCTSGFSRLN